MFFSFSSDHVDGELSVEEKHSWLKDNISSTDIDTLKTYWRDTYAVRRKYLQEDKATIAAYLNRYKVLTQNIGSELVSEI